MSYFFCCFNQSIICTIMGLEFMFIIGICTLSLVAITGLYSAISAKLTLAQYILPFRKSFMTSSVSGDRVILTKTRPLAQLSETGDPLALA